MEALVEPVLYQAKEGGGAGGFQAGLRPQPQDDSRCILQEEEHLKCGRVNTAPGGGTYRMWRETFCFPISTLVSAKEVKVPPPKVAPHFRVRSVASYPTNFA